MKYTVLVSSDAEKDMDNAYRWLLAQTAQHAPQWHDRLIDAFLSLEANPARCPVVLRDKDTSIEYRQLLFGDKRHAYRIIFYIRGESVRIGRIIHAARRWPSTDSTENGDDESDG